MYRLPRYHGAAAAATNAFAGWAKPIGILARAQDNQGITHVETKAMATLKTDRPTYTTDFIKSDTDRAVFLGNPLLGLKMITIWYVLTFCFHLVRFIYLPFSGERHQYESR